MLSLSLFHLSKTTRRSSSPGGKETAGVQIKRMAGFGTLWLLIIWRGMHFQHWCYSVLDIPRYMLDTSSSHMGILGPHSASIRCIKKRLATWLPVAVSGSGGDVELYHLNAFLVVCLTSSSPLDSLNWSGSLGHDLCRGRVFLKESTQRWTYCHQGWQSVPWFLLEFRLSRNSFLLGLCKWLSSVEWAALRAMWLVM